MEIKNEKKGELWLARDKDNVWCGGMVYLYTKKPKKNMSEGFFDLVDGNVILLGKREDLKGLTWENSPQRISKFVTDEW
jgi:spore maturation protein CgeB